MVATAMPHARPASPLSRPLRRGGRLATALACALLAGCIVVPRTAEVYDPACRSYVRQMVLETTVIGGMGACHNEGCAVMLASLGIISAATAVVSGSVALVGNVVYWVERQGQCPAPPEAPPQGPPRP